MSTIIAFFLVVIAAAMWFKKPIQLNIQHNHVYEHIGVLKDEDLNPEDKEAEENLKKLKAQDPAVLLQNLLLGDQ